MRLRPGKLNVNMTLEFSTLVGTQVRLEPLSIKHLDGLVAASAVDPSLYRWSAVPVGRDAVSTWGNAAEFAVWAARNRIGSAIVVTSFYHMRRALLEIGRAAPGVKLAAVKVPADPRLGAGEMRKLIDDYDKYLLALIGLSRFSPGHRAA